MIRGRWRWALAGVLGMLLVGLSLMVAVQRERDRREPYNRTVGPWLARQLVERIGIGNISVCRCRPDRVITLTRTDGLQTRANLYLGDRSPSSPKPVVVLIHGNTALGKNLPTYKTLASALANRGYLVLAHDQPGFGESDNPIRGDARATVEAFDQLPSAVAALEFLRELDGVDPARISVIGHSGGAFPAIKFAMSSHEVRHVALLGPPRRVREHAEASSAKAQERAMYWSKRFRRTYEFVYGEPLPSWFRQEMTRKGGPWALEDYEGFFRAGDRASVMLLDGELESTEDKTYLESFYVNVSEPKKFVRLAQSDHYHNTAQALGIAIYDRRVLKQLVDELEAFFGGTE